MLKDLNPEADQESAVRQILVFLRRHGLDIRPEHYELGYRLIVDRDPLIIAAAQRAIEAGRPVATTDMKASLRQAGAGEQRARELTVEVDRNAASLQDILSRSQSAARDYSDALQGSVQDLAAAARGESISSLVDIAGRMLARATQAEAELAEARTEVDGLREHLAEARNVARQDPLTQLPNRRAFEEKCFAELSIGNNLTIAICDIDRFKYINDTHGHNIGDRVLQFVAGCLEKTCEEHFVARLGGEEFVVLMSATNMMTAHRIIDAARRDVNAHDLKIRESGVYIGAISFSAGLAIGGKGEPPADILKRADENLYQAKNSGRNKVVF
ncbi:GGDEF domain-containing protein [Sphingomonas sp. LaA6.9]|uniref:GGDEF domain-containing protein n=1 Tax=Sphingomonas sp. LaA6.9 TaxID=2919914 RepID=UPI001F4FFD41|nr:GGDEF domain-containing protein [Sphingomonas sp. LaA6.9]MCJ8156786.1 GGDEF domain-containing protein [Sphingomonas sp. LaA6.9]